MSTLTVSIGGNAVTIRESTLKITSRVDDKDKATFTVRDDSGILTFQKGQTVNISDSVQGVLFAGYINKPTCTNLFPSSTNEWSIDCVNHFYVPAKRVTSTGTNSRRGGRRHRGGKHVKQHAGAIAALQIQEYLAPSGVNGNFGLDWTELATDWQAGTLSGTASTTNASTGNVGAGDLELAPAGSAMTHSESVTADFATGTLSSVAASNNSLILNGRQGLAISTQCTAQNGSNNYLYYKIWTGAYTIVSADSLQYSMWISAASPEIKMAVEITCSDGTSFKNSTSIIDQNGFAANAQTNLKGWADNQWYSRQISLTSIAGKVINAVSIGFEGDSVGTYAGYFYGIVIANGGSNNVVVYNGGSLNASALATKIGYGQPTISTSTVYDKSGYRNSAPISIASIGCIANSSIQYTVSAPSGTSATLNTSFDGGATWQSSTSQSTITGLFVGDNTASMSIATQELLSVTGNDPTVTPSFTAISWTITPALSATKTDSLTTYNSSGGFNGGTYTNTQLITSQATNTPTFLQNGSPQAVVLNGAWRNWNDESLTGQSVFGGATPIQSATQGQFVLSVSNAGNEVKSQFVFAGTWANFTAALDCQAPASGNEDVGLLYRTTNWDNTNYSWGYSAQFYLNSVRLLRGTNAPGGPASTLATATNLNVAAGSWHTLTVIANGSNHQVLVDGVVYINFNDSTFLGAGYIGARGFNNDTNTTHKYFFDNFGVVPALSGTWLSPSISLNSVATAGSSVLQWDQASLPAGTNITAQASIDGGSTYQPVSNGGAIPQIPAGTSLVGKSLLLLLTLISGSAVTSPALNSLSLFVAAQYSASGTRTNAPLAADTASRLNVGSGFGTSPTGMTYVQAGTGTTNLTSNELQIQNTTGDVHMQAGSLTGTDEEGVVRFSLSASTISAGLELRYNSVNSFYRFSASTTTLTLLKKSASLSVTLATASMALSTGVFYFMRFRVTGSSPVSLLARVWLAGTAEPTTWNVTGVD